jgi:DNA-binding transcriptional MerR regulator/methylmalonyl-CoA mutase cobalamin-binding subunit
MNEDAGSKKFYPIGYVARATGLSTHVIRAWENRYGVVRPARTPKNRRLYSKDDIDHLSLLSRAVSGGHTISQLSELNRAALLRMMRDSDDPSGGRVASSVDRDDNRLLAACLRAVYNLDPSEMEYRLLQASVKLSRMALFTRLITPLLEEIGRLWSFGSLKIIHEHMASAVIQGILWEMLRSAHTETHAPGMIVATPSGQMCQMGALMGSIIAADAGWKPHYFGPNLPAEEIAAASARKNVAAVALSITCQSDESAMERAFKRLKATLPEGVHLFVGGRASIAYQEMIEAVGGQCFSSLTEFMAAVVDIGIQKTIEPAPAGPGQ